MPDDMGFEIQDVPDEMYEGALLHYKVSPLIGIKLNWVSEITQIEKHRYFIDKQREGPFGYWQHEHRFREINSGTQIIDNLHYKLPLEPLFKLFHPLIVKNKITEIFETRKRKVREIFGAGN